MTDDVENDDLADLWTDPGTPTIAIQIVSVPNEARTIAAVRRLEPNTSIAQLRERIATRTPAFEYVLFRNDFAELAALIRAIVQAVQETGATVIPSLLLEGERFDQTDPARCTISMDGLYEILAYSDAYE